MDRKAVNAIHLRGGTRFGGMVRFATCIGIMALAFMPDVRAQNESTVTKWPEKPIRIILPYPPGGNTDVIARLIAQPLSEKLGQPVIVENRPGASGAIALDAVARAPADGYTLLITAVAQLAIVPKLIKTNYDPVASFAPISIIASNPLVLTVNSTFPARTLREFVDVARGRKGTMQYGSSGDGGVPHLTAVQFFARTGLEAVHVPYKGNAQVMNDILGGHVPAYFANLSEVLPHAAKGDLRFLAQTGDTRAPQLPKVPTVAEQGYPGFNSMTWNGLLAPAGTPKAIVDKLAALVIAEVKDPAIAAKLTAAGVVPVGSTPREFADTLRADMAIWAEAVRAAGLKQE
jgi:tripartite-type tricarboxylate transporter receptor subunit TctC